MRSDKLQQTISCFSRPCPLSLSYSDYENHKTVTYFQESHSGGTDGNNGCVVQCHYDGKDDYKLHNNIDYHMVRFSQRRMRSNSVRDRIRTKE